MSKAHGKGKSGAARPPSKRGLPPGRAARSSDNGLGLGGGGVQGYGQGLRAVFDEVSGLGSDMRSTRFVFPRILDEYELTALGMDGLVQRVITYPVTRALACGYELVFHSEVPDDLREALLNKAADVAQRLEVDSRVGLLGIRARWYGDAIQAIAFEGDQGPGALATAPAWGQRVRWLSVWDRRDWQPANYETVDSPRYRQTAWLHLMLGRPLLESERWYGYRTGSYAQVPLHPRRYVRLHTVSGFSIFQHIAPYLVSLLASAQGASNLIQRASLGHFKIRDWGEMVRSRGGEAQALIQGQYAAMSGANIVVTDGIGDDANEDFEQHTTPLSGIAEGIYSSAYLFSGASGMPMARVMGTSPGAFQSGELQDNMWYELLGDMQAWLTPALRWTWDGVFAEVLGSGRAPVYEIKWNSPRVVSDAVQIEMRGKALEQAIKGIAASLLTPDAAIAALNSDSPAGFQYERPAAATPAEAAQPAADPASLAPIVPSADPVVPEGTDPLSDVALNGAQVQSLVSVATDPILTAEAKEAIIVAAYPAIPRNLVSIIARGLAPAGAAPIAAAGAPGGPVATPAAAGVEEAADGDAEPEGEDSEPPAEPDLWRTPEQIAERFGAVTGAQLKRHAASAPQIKEAGKLTWIRIGRGRLYKLSDVEERWGIAGADLETGTGDDPAAEPDDS